jgi:hypothetical protein
MPPHVIRKRNFYFRSARSGEKEQFDIAVSVSGGLNDGADEARSPELAAEETIGELRPVFEKLIESGKIYVPAASAEKADDGRLARLLQLKRGFSTA